MVAALAGGVLRLGGPLPLAGCTGVVVPVERPVPATGYVPHAHARAGLPRIAVARENHSV